MVVTIEIEPHTVLGHLSQSQHNRRQSAITADKAAEEERVRRMQEDPYYKGEAKKH